MLPSAWDGSKPSCIPPPRDIILRPYGPRYRLRVGPRERETQHVERTTSCVTLEFEFGERPCSGSTRSKIPRRRPSCTALKHPVGPGIGLGCSTHRLQLPSIPSRRGRGRCRARARELRIASEGMTAQTRRGTSLLHGTASWFQNARRPPCPCFRMMGELISEQVQAVPHHARGRMDHALIRSRGVDARREPRTYRGVRGGGGGARAAGL